MNNTANNHWKFYSYCNGALETLQRRIGQELPGIKSIP